LALAEVVVVQTAKIRLTMDMLVEAVVVDGRVHLSLLYHRHTPMQ
jgi:hypothetical protein